MGKGGGGRGEQMRGDSKMAPDQRLTFFFDLAAASDKAPTHLKRRQNEDTAVINIEWLMSQSE